MTTVSADRAAQLENGSLPYAKENIKHRKGLEIKGRRKEDYDIQ
jgi:hypothetical protein